MMDIEKVAKIHAEKVIDERLCGHYLTVMKNFIFEKDKKLIFVFKQHQLEAFAKAMLEAAPPADVEPVAWRNPNDNHRASAFMWQQSATHSKPVFTHPPADKDAERIEQLEDCLDKIRSWCKAYPTTIFTEPNWDEVQEKLGKNLLCQVSGSNMRHVTTGIQKIIDATMGEAMGEV